MTRIKSVEFARSWLETHGKVDGRTRMNLAEEIEEEVEGCLRTLRELARSNNPETEAFAKEISEAIVLANQLQDWEEEPLTLEQLLERAAELD